MSIDIELLHSKFETELAHIKFYGLKQVDSTNLFLKSICKDSVYDGSLCCIATEQLAGYGQRNKPWLSNNNSLTFSVAVNPPFELHNSNGFAQYLGVRLCSTLNTVSNNKACIKWPNDLFTEGGKFSGILIESISNQQNQRCFVIGIGINLSDDLVVDETQYSISALKHRLSNEDLILLLVNTVLDSTEQFQSQRNLLVNEFQKNDYFMLGQKVIVYHNQLPLKGVYRGINEEGMALVEIDNTVRCFISGETSIRADNNE